MLSYTIKSKPHDSKLPKFFVQSHGHHAGRPLKEPIPNSFTILLEQPENLHIAFYTCKMLYQSNALYPIQRGSVIPFISLHEYKKVFAAALRTTMQDPIKFAHVSSALDLIEQKIKKNLEENNALKEMEMLLLSRYR
jgi:hypothetical protein